MEECFPPPFPHPFPQPVSHQHPYVIPHPHHPGNTPKTANPDGGIFLRFDFTKTLGTGIWCDITLPVTHVTAGVVLVSGDIRHYAQSLGRQEQQQQW
jgi:hypothetical protein